MSEDRSSVLRDMKPGDRAMLDGTGKREGRCVGATVVRMNIYTVAFVIDEADRRNKADHVPISIHISTGHTSGAQNGRTGWRLGMKESE